MNFCTPFQKFQTETEQLPTPLYCKVKIWMFTKTFQLFIDNISEQVNHS